MNDLGLHFYPSGAVTVFCVVLVVVTALLCWLAWHRSEYRRGTGLLELLRLTLVLLVAVTLHQPEWLDAEAPEERPTLAVLWDQSNSMETRDVIDERPNQPKSRAETIAPLLSADAWKPKGAGEPDDESNEELEIVFEPFSSQMDPAKEATDLSGGLLRVLDSHASLRGVVLLSDGDWNAGKSPVEAATRYRMRGVPVFTVPVGSRTPLPDLELVSMDAPTFGVAGKPLRIPFAIRSTLAQDREVSVSLKVDGAPTKTKVIRVPAMGLAEGSMIWRPSTTGERELGLSVSRDAQEILSDNNELSAPISIRREQLKVLVVESTPRWEYRYLRNALERDPGVEVTCLLFHPGLPKVGGGRTYIQKFPNAGELSRFDVVFLGDVGIGPKQLTVDDARSLRQLVSAQAAGLVFLPGRSGGQATLLASPLGDLYPIVPDDARPYGVGSSAPGHFVLTEAGQRSLLTRLGESDRSSVDIWRALPGFHWYAGTQRAKAGSQVLAVHERDTTTFGRVPLIVTKTYGTGKVLFMGTDGAWRWREGVEDRYHYRYWGQVARWMAYQRQMAQGQSIRLFYSPDRPRTGDVVSLGANVLDGGGGPLAAGTVVVQAISPSGKTKTVRLEPGEEDAWGLFRGSFTPEEPGNYRLVASCSETAASIETDLSVGGIQRERRGQPVRFDVLEEIAKITKGRTLELAELGRLQDELAALPEPEPTIHRTRIWSHPAWAAVLILLLAVFWSGRKAIGSI